jgi:hypothetical protein
MGRTGTYQPVNRPQFDMISPPLVCPSPSTKLEVDDNAKVAMLPLI